MNLTIQNPMNRKQHEPTKAECECVANAYRLSREFGFELKGDLVRLVANLMLAGF